MNSSAPTCSGRAHALGIFAAAEAPIIKAAAEEFIPLLGRIEVLVNKTGLVMLPYADTAHGTPFFLGEVLVAQAHLVCPEHEVEGYALVVGRDLEQAMAVAILDAAGAAGVAADRFDAVLAKAHGAQVRADHARRCDIEATRVQMETF